MPPEVNPALFGDQSEYAERCMTDFQDRNDDHNRRWGLFRADWQADMTSGTLTFSGPRYTVETRLQVVGTYNTDNGSWLWGWDHPSVPPEQALAAQAARAYAEHHSLSTLLTPRLICEPQDAWAFTTLAAALQEAQGVYRAPMDALLVFMTFTDVRLRQPQELN